MSTISVIMAIYNTEEFLEQSIQSVLDQSYQTFELLLIDDNSNETCDRKIKELAGLDNRIKCFQFQERKGVGAARNYGIEQASGEYIYFLDSDDYLSPNTLQLLLENIGEYDMISGKLKRTHLSEVTEEPTVNDSNMDLKDEIKVKLFKENKFNLIRNNSVLNRLIKKDFILSHHLCFAEDTERYADLAFMVPALLNTREIPYIKSSLYYKRRRNDPLSNPALMQAPAEDRIKDFLHMYIFLKENYTQEDLNVFLDKKFLNYYRKTIVRFFRINENVDSVFPQLLEAVNRIDNNHLVTKSAILKKEIVAIKSADIERFKKVNLKHLRLRKLRNAVKSKGRLFTQIYRSVFLKMPVKKNMVVFESFLGKNYSDSPKYIYEYMLENKLDFHYVWIFNEKRKVPGNPTQVRRFSLRYYYYLARAKYWVSNSRMPRRLNKRDENIYLQTWHGTPLKTLVFDMKDIHSADPKYKQNFYKQSRRWDYLSSPNRYSSDIFKRAFLFDKEMLEFGYPRNDILYQKNTEKDIFNLKQKMNLPTDKKVVLYAPTWRDDEFYARGKYKFTLQLDLERMQKHLGDDYVVLLRMHYFIASQMDISGFEGFVYDFSSYDDIAELYLVSDILITDYSSVFFDYANLKRPILFYTYDLERYRDKLRGFYIDIEEEVPGPLVKTSDEVIRAIQNIDSVQNEYQEKYEAFYNRFCTWDDGYASEKTVKKVFKQ